MRYAPVVRTLALVVVVAASACRPAVTGTPTPPSPRTPPPTTRSTAMDGRIGAVFFTPQLNSVDLPCADMRAIGVGSTFFGAWQGQIEGTPGQYDWSSVDGPVNAALACGTEPLLKISTGAPGSDGVPPSDMQAYTRFVSSLAQRFKGRVRAYAIENEIDNPRMVWTAETYGPLRAAAYQAIKQADPDALVLDGGMTMQAYLMARADELVRAGQPQQALDMLARATASMRRKEANLPTTEAKLTQWLSRPNAVRGIGLVRELYANPATYDAVQLHYLQDAWEFMPEYISWVRAWSSKPYEFWEIGYGWEGETTGAAFSEEDHAYGVVKTLVTALGEGASRVIHEPYWEDSSGDSGTPRADRKVGRGLVTPGGPRLAATAYHLLVSQIHGYSRSERLDLGAGVWAYRFTTPRGDVYVVWAQASTSVQLPLSAAQVAVSDISGNVTQADPTSVPVGAGPVFVSTP